MKNKIIFTTFIIYIIASIAVYNLFINTTNKELNKNFMGEIRNIKDIYVIGWEDFPHEIIDKFNKEYPYIKINYEKTDKQNYSNLLKAKIASKGQVDIMSIMPNDYKYFIDKGYLMDISKEAYLDHYIPKIREEVKELSGLDKEYVVCYKSYVYGVWYNKTLFEKWQIDIPSNYNEFLDVCKKIKKQGVSPLVLGVRDNWYSNYIYLLRLPQIDEKNREWMDKSKRVSLGFENPEVKSIRQDIEKFIKEDNLMPDSKYLTYYQAFYEFSRGKAAMMIADDDSLGLVTSNMEKVMEPGVFPLPYNTQGVTTKTPKNSQALMMGIFSHSEHTEEAKIFLAYLSRPEIAQMYCDLMAFPPNIKGVNSRNIKYNYLWETIRDMPETELSIDNLHPETLNQFNLELREVIKKE